MVHSFRNITPGYEASFALQAEYSFRIVTRRNQLLGQWVAACLGYDAERTQAYAAEVIAADLTSPGDDDVIGKVWLDLAAADVPCCEDVVRRKLAAFEEDAREQIMAELAN